MPSTGNKPQKFTLERVYARVEIQPGEDGCHLWTGHTVSGYGQIKAEGKHRYVHVVAYECRHGSLPPGLLVLHKCDIRNCVRDEHLFVGTHQDNADDKVRKGRHRNGKPMLGKKFSQESRAKMSWTRIRNNFASMLWAFTGE